MWQIGLAVGLVAAAAGIVVYAAARVAGVPMELTEVFEDQFARMPVLNMAWAALLDGALPGTVLAALCRRWAARPRLSFIMLTAVGFLASFVLPVTSDASTATKAVLSFSHMAAAAIIIPPLTIALPSKRGSRLKPEAAVSGRTAAVTKENRPR